MHKQLSSFTAIVGIDWADKKHDVCVQALSSSQRQFDRFSHKVEAIDEWACSLYRRHGGRMAVAVELSKGPIVAALQKYDFFAIYPINPTTLARYRQAFNPSGAKDDPTDAELAQQILLGGFVLPPAALKRLQLPGRRKSTGVQMDPDHLPLLDLANPVR